MINFLLLFLDAKITTFVNDSNVLQAIYFQTSEMMDSFRTYPELVFIDATYKLNDLRMPLYVSLVVDGNGESIIICLWVVQSEDKETITSLLVEFKTHNENWPLIKCVMSDKDMTERNVIKEQFPQASLLICLFHTLRSFRREISCEKLGISQSERIMCLELISKMAYAQSEESYASFYDEFIKCAPQRVVDYFNANWHDIHEQWVDGMKNSQCNYMNRTNNRVESINAKLKMVITRYSGMTQFFNDLMQCLSSLRVERNHRALEVTTKRRITKYDPTSVLGKYIELLTPYAFEYVQKQFELAEKVKILEDVDDNRCTIDARQGQLVSSIDGCSCVYASSMRLPCQHIFATHHYKGLSEYHEDLCADRWKLQHFLQNHPVFHADCDNCESEITVDTISSAPVTSKVLTEQEKYKQAFQVAQCLAQQLSTVGMKDFEEGLQLLQTIKLRWDEGKKLNVLDVNVVSGNYI